MQLSSTNYIYALGYTAAFLSTMALIPQVVRAWKTSSTKDISATTFVTIATAAVFWSVYGIMRADLPVTLTNLATFLLAITILLLKVRNG